MDDNEKAKDIISTKETQTSLDYQTLGMIYQNQKLLAEALKSYLHALQLDLNSIDKEILFDYYGNPLHVSEHTEAIVDVAEMELLERLSTMSNNKSYYLFENIYHIASVYHQQEKYNLAEDCYKRCLLGYKDLCGDDAVNNELGYVLDRQGANYEAMGQYSDSEEY